MHTMTGANPEDVVLSDISQPGKAEAPSSVSGNGPIRSSRHGVFSQPLAESPGAEPPDLLHCVCTHAHTLRHAQTHPTGRNASSEVTTHHRNAWSQGTLILCFLLLGTL